MTRPLKNMGFLWDKRLISVKANPANPFVVRVYGIKNQERITRLELATSTLAKGI